MKRYLKKIFKILIGAIVLLLLIVAAGILYVKFSGEAPAEQSSPLPVNASAPQIKPPQISPKAKESVVLQTISSPVKRGSDASISIKTNPSSKCRIEAAYKDKNDKDVIYKNSALSEKKADEFGLLSWEWPLVGTAPAGPWKVKVTCFYYKNSAVVIGDMLVK